MHMMVPVSAGTLSVVCVINRNQAMPASAAGSAVMMMKGQPGLKVHHDEEVDKHNGEDSPDNRPIYEERMSELAASTTCDPRAALAAFDR